MHNTYKLTDNIIWVGANDRRLELFENAYPLPEGISYNSFIIKDEYNALIDGTDSAVTNQFLENVEYALSGKKLDYIIINHIEPDHCNGLVELALRYPDVIFVGNVKTIKLLTQFYPNLKSKKFQTVIDGDNLKLGKHILNFYFAPMVHWPEVMMCYESNYKILFSADAFGSFRAHNGNMYFENVVDKENYINEIRRYYANIVGKYGAQTAAILKKLSSLEISVIAPLHGAFLRGEGINIILDKYKKWSAYIPEEDSVTIMYGSVYGNTQQAAEKLSYMLAELGVKNIRVYDVSKTHYSYIISDIFRTSTVVSMTSTYNNALFASSELVLLDILNHNIINRKFAIVENGSWSPQANKITKNIISSLKNTTILSPEITINSTCNEQNIKELQELAINIKNNF